MKKASKAARPPRRLLTLYELSRRANISYARAVRMLDAGKLRPDFVTGKEFLFFPRRLAELERLLTRKASTDR